MRRLSGLIWIRFAILVLGLSAVLPGQGASAADPDRMSPEEVSMMYRRMIELGCAGQNHGGGPRDVLREMLKRCPDPTPFVSIETGRTTNPIRRVAVDAACRVAVTNSYDKTLRMWSLPDGAPLKVLRFPYSPGDEFDGLAMSPDGRWVAVGGWDARERKNTAFLWDTQSDDPIRPIARSGNQIGALAFSPDGKRLAVAVGDEGLHILDMPSGREIAVDRHYSEMTNGLAFGADGTLFAVSYDGTIRRYGADGVRAHKVRTQAGDNPYTVAVSRDGARVAIGFADARQVEIVDARTLEPIKLTDTKRWSDDNVSRVAWDAAGRAVVGGDTGRPSSPLHLFDKEGRHLRDLDRVSFLLDIQPCGDATILSAVEPSLALLRADGTLHTVVGSDAADMRYKTGDAFKVSVDGMKVLFNAGFGKTGIPILIDVAAGAVIPSPDGVEGLAGPIVDTLAIDRSDGTVDLKASPKPPLARDYSGQTLAIRPDRQGFVLGSWSRLRAFSGTGKRIWTAKTATPVGGVQLAADGKLVIAALMDGTIRWYRWADGAELLAVFVNRNDLSFVAWTPSGYYHVSQGGEASFGWQFNSNWSRFADFLPGTTPNLRRLHRPDVIRNVLPLLDERAAARAANGTGRDRI
jgi:WD40 repeat protein